MQKSVIEYLYNTVSNNPHKNAVKDATGSVTFEELWNFAISIATTINQTGSRNKPIGVYMPKGCKMVEAFAGISMSCNFYVPLDVKSPLTRISSIIDVLDADLIISDREHADIIRKFCDRKVIEIEEALEKPVVDDTWERKMEEQIDTDPVYSIFTSGSTGVPKGVVVSHRSVIDFVDWIKEVANLGPEDVIGNQAPFYFDNSTMDIYLMYSTGATLCIIPEDRFMFPVRLVEFLNENKVSHILWVPYLMMNVVNMNIFEKTVPRYLKNVFFAGEVLPVKYLRYWQKYLPNCVFSNMYGPTEITDICCYYVVDRELDVTESIPIGHACRNTGLLVLVDGNREASVGEEGELCVRGSSLAMGYYNDWEKTKKAFVQNPLNSHYPETIYCTGDVVYKNTRGELVYIGRKDSQIKHNGYRIELGEIENAVMNSELVQNCCVVYDNQNKKIVLFYESAQEFDVGVFRKRVCEMIPRYMFPTEFYKEEKLKQNGSGKIDRAYYKKLINDRV